jgi:hypothetical protein
LPGGPIVPITIEREIPREAARELDVVGRVRGKIHSARLRKGREQNRIKVETRLIELEEFHICGDQGGGNVLCGDGKNGWVVNRVLPREAPNTAMVALLVFIKNRPIPLPT